MKTILIGLLFFSFIISCSKIEMKNVSISKLNNNEINSLDITNSFVNKSFSERQKKQTWFDLLIDKKISGLNKFESEQKNYFENKAIFDRISNSILSEEKRGLNYNFKIINNFGENIEQVYFTSQIIFNFPNGIKTYIDNFQANTSNWKIDEALNVNRNCVINFAKYYDNDAFKNHIPKKVTLKIYLHAKNSVGYELDKNDKNYYSELGHFENEREMNCKKILEKDITDLWLKNIEEKRLNKISIENLTYLAPEKLQPVKTIFTPNVKSYFYNGGEKIIIQYGLDLSKSSENSFGNNYFLNYISLEGFMKNYISSLGNVSNLKLNELETFKTNSYYDDKGYLTINGSFTKNGKEYLASGKSFFDKESTNVNAIFMIYKSSIQNKAEMIQILNSIKFH